ncbi:PYRD1 protein, partial [Polypterus senegalus]
MRLMWSGAARGSSATPEIDDGNLEHKIDYRGELRCSLGHSRPNELRIGKQLVTVAQLEEGKPECWMVSKTLEEFDIEEQSASALRESYPNILVIESTVTELNTAQHRVTAENGKEYVYGQLCICAGARPKLIEQNNPYVLGIRDTDTAKAFQKRLSDARRVIVVGNGGIALELVYEIEGCEVIWAIKDKDIGNTFFDPGAAQFLLPSLMGEKPDVLLQCKRTKFTTEGGDQQKDSSTTNRTLGSALGPDWHEGMKLKGTRQVVHKVHIEYQCEVDQLYLKDDFLQLKKTPIAFPENKEEEKISKPDNDLWPVYIRLTNGKIYGCDFIVSATGVVPNIEPFVKDATVSITIS